jgi:hypothetical protein
VNPHSIDAEHVIADGDGIREPAALIVQSLVLQDGGWIERNVAQTDDCATVERDGNGGGPIPEPLKHEQVTAWRSVKLQLKGPQGIGAEIDSKARCTDYPDGDWVLRGVVDKAAAHSVVSLGVRQSE